MKIGTIQALACVGLGLMLGFIAASRGFSPASRADETPTAARQNGAGTGTTDREGDGPSCCSDEVATGVLLAQAGTQSAGSRASAPLSGKKPNILVIFGDDIGTWNVGAYTHGMMGRTPNIDRIAREGILFTDH